VARRCLFDEASVTPGFGGAFYHGSTNWLPDHAPLPATSDVDIMVGLDNPDPPLEPGKTNYRDVLLEIFYLPSDRLQAPERVLGQYHPAGSFQSPSIILDQSGWLIELQAAVARDSAKRRWIWWRCEHGRTGFCQASHCGSGILSTLRS
jgi:hypothetical protein